MTVYHLCSDGMLNLSAQAALKHYIIERGRGKNAEEKEGLFMSKSLDMIVRRHDYEWEMSRNKRVSVG